MKKVALLLANGFEETEALVPADMIERAGISVVKVGVCDIQDKPANIEGGKYYVEGSHRLNVFIDTAKDDCMMLDEKSFDKIAEFDAIILPGGMRGAKNLAQSTLVKKLLESFKKQNKLIAAICASPAAVLAKNGIIKAGKDTAICYPGCESLSGISDNADLSALFTGAPEVRKGVCQPKGSNIITARAAGSSFEFAFTIIDHLTAGKTTSCKVSSDVIY